MNIENGRKKIIKKSEKDLHKALVEFYLDDGNKTITIKEFYSDWMIKRSLSVDSAGTLRRNDQHWKKYYLESDMVAFPLEN